MKGLLLIPLIAFGLVACGDKSPGSFGVNLEKSSTTSTDSTTSVGSDKKIDTSDKTSVSVKIAASVILADAVNQFCDEAGIKPPYRKKFFAVGDKTLAGKVSPKLANRTVTATILAIAASFEPAIGWPDGGEDVFMRKSAALANFANAIATEVIGKVSQSALKNPDEAKQAVITAIAAIPASTLEAIWASKVAEAKAAGTPSANLAGSNTPIEFKLGRQVVTIGPQGMHLVSNGATLYGDGKVGGKSIDVALETSLTTGLGRKLSLDSKATQGEAETVKVDAGIKH